jgi:hypothetical protein
MSDEERTKSPDPDAPLTGDVRDTALVRQGHGGAIRTKGNPQNHNPTPNDVRSKSRKEFYTVIPRIARIAKNVAKKGKKPKHTTIEQLRAADILGKYGNDDRISAADLREACRGMASDIRDFLPQDQADALIAIVARRFVYL